MTSSITGMVKVFYTNYIELFSNTVAASTGTNQANIYDRDRETQWSSVGSDDSTVETLTITFDSQATISRLFCVGMNWKNFTIQYDAGGGYTDFSNVYSLKADAAAALISYSDNSETTRYFEFDAVAVNSVKITMNTTIVVDAEKTLIELYIGKEMGTFSDDVISKPNKAKINFDYGEKIITLSNVGSKRYQRGEKFKGSLTLKQIDQSNDQTIIYTMFDQGDFMISLCGADGTLYPTIRHWRLQDVYSCILKGDLSGEFDFGRDSSMGIKQKLDMLER